MVRVGFNQAQRRQAFHTATAMVTLLAKNFGQLTRSHRAMLLNDEQREFVFLSKFAAEAAERGIEGLADFNRLSFHALNLAKPQLKCRAEDSLGLLKERVKKQLLRRFLEAQPPFYAVNSWIAGVWWCKLEPQAGETVPLQNCILKIGARDISESP